ncbi:uncharacterized protein BDZ99DRAFT_559461, partial [Mytilinidion resinicola]
CVVKVVQRRSGRQEQQRKRVVRTWRNRSLSRTDGERSGPCAAATPVRCAGETQHHGDESAAGAHPSATMPTARVGICLPVHRPWQRRGVCLALRHAASAHGTAPNRPASLIQRQPVPASSMGGPGAVRVVAPQPLVPADNVKHVES